MFISNAEILVKAKRIALGSFGMLGETTSDFTDAVGGINYYVSQICPEAVFGIGGISTDSKISYEKTRAGKIKKIKILLHERIFADAYMKKLLNTNFIGNYDTRYFKLSLALGLAVVKSLEAKTNERGVKTSRFYELINLAFSLYALQETNSPFFEAAKFAVDVYSRNSGMSMEEKIFYQIWFSQETPEEHAEIRLILEKAFDANNSFEREQLAQSLSTLAGERHALRSSRFSTRHTTTLLSGDVEHFRDDFYIESGELGEDVFDLNEREIGTIEAKQKLTRNIRREMNDKATTLPKPKKSDAERLNLIRESYLAFAEDTEYSFKSYVKATDALAGSWEGGSFTNIVVKDIADIKVDKLTQYPITNEWTQVASSLRAIRSMEETLTRPTIAGKRFSISRYVNSHIVPDNKLMLVEQKENLLRDTKIVLLVDLSASMKQNDLITKVSQESFGLFKSLAQAGFSVLVLGHTSTRGRGWNGLSTLIYRIAGTPDYGFTAGKDFSKEFGKLPNTDLAENNDGEALLMIPTFLYNDGRPTWIISASDGRPNFGGWYGSWDLAVEAIDILRNDLNIRVSSLSVNESVMQSNNQLYGESENIPAFGTHMRQAFKDVAQSLSSIAIKGY